jgi:hypothetical protein
MSPYPALLENRVTRLEELMAELTENVNRLSYEMREFKDEMREFKVEMQDFKEEERASRVEMNRKWGELSHKMGTMAEDLVAPSIGRILRQTVNCPDDRIEWSAVRMRRRHLLTAQSREFDVVAACGEYLLINETKSRLRPEDCDEFIHLLQETRNYFPEEGDKQVIGALASLYVDPSLVVRGERLGLIILGFGDDVMQVLNSPGFVPRPF